MSAPFEPGEMVVCVQRRHSYPYGVLVPGGITLGGVYQVVWCEPSSVANIWKVRLPHDPAEYPCNGWPHTSFRKLRPNELAARETWHAMLDAKPVLAPGRHERERATAPLSSAGRAV